MTAQTCPRQHQRTTMEIASLEPSLYTVKAVFILDNDGNRLLSKYYDTELYPSMKEQKNFEKNVFNKTHKADNEIAFVEGMTIVYKCSIDLFFYVVGSAQENELMLMAVLNCLFESLGQILRKNVERRCLLDNMDGVFLVVDEIIDGGVILESDPQQVIQKVNYRVRQLQSLTVSTVWMNTWILIWGQYLKTQMTIGNGDFYFQTNRRGDCVSWIVVESDNLYV
ncbi:coatomer subunit zeta-1 isoform X2 [Oncorhynchus mykiss]|uniref:coatomer subunit zeta-1 isoform X2 n=2 Tax=Oncorhynchus mykiss TaxID=8022 RepID=UPI001633294E|nr:coatomer subunit zeta-1 isoform X2 [Oncorhynchus mykiss]